MQIFGKLSIAAAMLMASTAISSAADIIPDPEPVPEVVPVVQSSGWYLRGDIGYAGIDVGDVTYGQFYTGPPPAYSWNTFGQADVDSTWYFQGGVGYQVNDYFRVDWTLGYFNEAGFDGRSSTNESFDCNNLSNDNGIADTCVVSDTGSLSMTTLMANAYMDLGNFNGITPYVGAGIGGAKVKWGNLSNNVSCTGGDCLNGTGENYNSIHDREHQGAGNDWRFAWAFHAGASFDVTCDTKIDAGYTYTRVEGGDMFNWAAGSGAVGLDGPQGYSGDIGVNAGTVGLRYQIGGCQQAYIPQEVPIYK